MLEDRKFYFKQVVINISLNYAVSINIYSIVKKVQHQCYTQVICKPVKKLYSKFEEFRRRKIIDKINYRHWVF